MAFPSEKESIRLMDDSFPMPTTSLLTKRLFAAKESTSPLGTYQGKNGR